jgi:periplasmic divalent cation tolerance protein
MTDCRLIYVTTKDREEAQRIARTVVKERLAACANVLGDIESFYHWEGKFEEGSEVLVLLKTRAELETSLIERIKTLHSYSCPAIVSLAIASGHAPFLAYIAEETAPVT